MTLPGMNAPLRAGHHDGTTDDGSCVKCIYLIIMLIVIIPTISIYTYKYIYI